MLIDFTIRLATIKDAKAVHEILLDAFEEYRSFYSPEGFTDTVLSEEKAKDRIKDMKVYVAVDQQSKIIGTIGWQKLNKFEGHIRGMGVIPSRQGKRSPAMSLLKCVERDAQLEKCKILTLDTTEILKRAQKFYEKNGYKRTGKIGDFFGSIIYEFAKTL
ncbi:MAG: GNAT family N-acetyltransferase [Candidatus Hermodarchaeota archaeon]